jgi:hypothetical protein
MVRPHTDQTAEWSRERSHSGRGHLTSHHEPLTGATVVHGYIFSEEHIACQRESIRPPW